MSKTYTPGPWTNDPLIGVTFGPDGKAIQTGGGGCSEETQANARLIAAAPELLDGCKAALAAFERGDAINWDDLHRAIEKAEGRES